MHTYFRSGVWLAIGLLVGVLADRTWHQGLIPTVSAQEGRATAPAPPMTMAQMQAEIERLKTLTPSYSHGMQDVAINWASLWFAAQKKNWPLARYLFNESRNHIAWTIRFNPIAKVNNEPVDLKAIFDAIDTSSLTMVKTAIEKQDSAEFASSYKVMLESCYSCHKAAGKPMIRPMIPPSPGMTIINYDPNATWPH